MKLLAFDTSTQACVVGLMNGHQMAVLQKVAPMQQARLILPMIDALLTQENLTIADLDAIAYGVGPGSFTGIRIANSVAQGLGFASKRPLIRISSLAAIAQTVLLEQQWANLLIATDARMDQVYWAIYQANQHGRMTLVGEEQLCVPQEVTLPEVSDWCAVGDAWDKYQEKLIARIGGRPAQIMTAPGLSAQALVTLALAKLERGETDTALGAESVYLR